MKNRFGASAALAILFLASNGVAQEVAPFFDAVPSVAYETYLGVNRPEFDEYFEMLKAKYEQDGSGVPWAIFNQNAKIAYRVTVLPDGLESLPAIRDQRNVSFQEFDEELLALWRSAWGTRHLAVYNAVPSLSYVPDDLSLEDIRALPYNRVVVYHLRWDQGPAFSQALTRRAELDREHGIDNMVLTTWSGGVGTTAQVVMMRVHAESQEADRTALAERMEIRQGYWDEWTEQNRLMNEAAWHMERFEQTRSSALSYPR